MRLRTGTRIGVAAGLAANVVMVLAGLPAAWAATSVAIGEHVEIGGLRITPASVSIKDLGLRRASTPAGVPSVPLRRRLALVLELENISKSDVFAGDVLSHSIKDDAGHALNGTLTIEDWIVEGSEEDKSLKPGDKATIILGAAPVDPAALSFAWSIRLRVASGPKHQGEEILVEFPQETIVRPE